MSLIGYHAKTLSDLITGMEDAGFSDGSIIKLVKSLPCRRFDNPHEGILRKLYLAHLGLADFVLKPGIVSMFTDEKCSQEESIEFRNGPINHYKIHPDDMKYSWNMELNLDKLTLRPAIPANWKKKQVTLKSALTSFQKSVPENLRANYWHGMWLSLHQEFIPDEWKSILRNRDGYRGRIIFPGVRLLNIPQINDYPEEIHYPYMEVDTGGYKIKFDWWAMQIKCGQTYEVVGKNDYFACFSG